MADIRQNWAWAILRNEKLWIWHRCYKNWISIRLFVIRGMLFFSRVVVTQSWSVTVTNYSHSAIQPRFVLHFFVITHFLTTLIIISYRKKLSTNFLRTRFQRANSKQQRIACNVTSGASLLTLHLCRLALTLLWVNVTLRPKEMKTKQQESF